MKLSLRLEHLLKESGMAPDSPWLLDMMLKSPPLRRFAFRYLRFKFTPLILDRIRYQEASLQERAHLFTAAISFINAGETYKTTGASRTQLVDQAILNHAQRYEDVHLVEVGASDGVASLELLNKLPNLREATLTDRHPSFYRGMTWPFALFLDGDRRILGIKIFGIYINLSPGRQLPTTDFREISTLNPRLVEEKGIKSILPFDVRKSSLEQPVEIIKCANLFNRKYFPDNVIIAAINNLGRSIKEGGFLFISQNNECYEEGEAYFVMKKHDGILRLTEDRNNHEAAFLFR